MPSHKRMAKPNSLAKVGLEVLYAKLGPNESADVAQHDLTKEIRERYWIRQAENVRAEAKTFASSTMPWRIERSELGRNRSDPGDGFRYVLQSATGTRAEWFEVTEVFQGVDPKDIEAFIRLENGGEGYPGFDPRAFLAGLNLGMPGRVAQRQAADEVLARVECKLAKSSYRRLPRSYGYGTLVVGLPLWFATYPLNPLRVENVVDDFMTRVLIGLKPYVRRLRKRTCPFWRIVVVWNGSVQSAREWIHRARWDVYADPVYSSMGSPLAFGASMLPVLLDAMEDSRPARPDGAGQLGMSVAAAQIGKREEKQHLQLPRAVTRWGRRLDEVSKSHRVSAWARIMQNAGLRLLGVVCFVRAHGIGHLGRWVASRLSPRRRLKLAAMRWRALRLYRRSEKRGRFG